MFLSIVTVSWKSKNDLERLIKSLNSHISHLDHELIVVDNNSQDGTVEYLKSNHPNVKVIANDFNAGYALGMNQGIKISQGEYVACINPDMMLTEDCFTPLIEKFKSNDKIGLIAPQLRYEDNSIQPTIKRDPSLISQVLILLKLHHIFKPKSLKSYLAKDIDYTKEQEVEQLMGAFILSSKNKWEKIGYWDEDYPLWWEDIQLCTDSRKKGFVNFYYPKTSLIHFEGKSFAQVLSLVKQKRFNFGMRLYFKKNFGYFSYALLLALHPISLLLAWTVQTLKIKPKTQSKL